MIARKSLFIVLSNYTIQIVGFIGFIVLAKLWGNFAPVALGSIGFAMSFVGIFNIVADLGFSQAHVKRVSEGKDLGSCIGTYAAIKVVLTAIMVMIVLTSLFIWKNVFKGNFYDTTTETIIYVFLIYYVFSNLSQIPLITFVANREMAKANIPNIFGRMVKVPLSIFVALAGVNGVIVANLLNSIPPGINWPDFLLPIQKFFSDHAIGSQSMTYTIDMFVVFVIAIWFLRKYPIRKPDLQLLKSYSHFAMPAMVSSVVGVIAINADNVMIGYFWTNVEVGYYFSVQRIFEIITVFYASISIILFPTLSEFHSSNKIKKIIDTTHLVERYASMVIVPVMIFIIVFAYRLIDIMLDTAFLPAASVLIILTILAFIESLNTPYSTLISGMNRPGIIAKVGIITCVVHIVLNYLFIPKNGLLSSITVGSYKLAISGAKGAAAAMAISALIGFFYYRFASKKLTGIKLLQTHTPRHLIAGFVMGISLYFLAFYTSFFPVIRWYTLFFFAGVGLLIYLCVLFLLREFNKRDLLFFVDVINPKKMFKYISSELKEKPKNYS